VQSTGLVEEPISSELVLVDRELALRARVALPDPPWLLPVLAELQQAEAGAPPVVTEERSAQPAVAARPRRRSVARHIATTVAGVCLLFVVAALAASATDHLSTSGEPTFVTTPEQHAAARAPMRSSAAAPAGRRARSSKPRAKQAARRAKARRAVIAKASPKGTPTARGARAKPGTIAAAPKPRPAAKSRPRVPGKTQRVFTWHRHAAAVYYQLYLRRGATTIYQARTVKLSTTLPARLKLEPGTYQVLVRPAIPSDAGIILGAVIVNKTMRV
jgi:hypothetical protein